VTQFNVFDQCLIALGRMKLLSGLNLARLFALYSFIPVSFLVWGVKGAIIAVPASAAVNTLILLGVQARLRLLDIRLELRLVPLLGIGLALGALVRWAVG